MTRIEINDSKRLEALRQIEMISKNANKSDSDRLAEIKKISQEVLHDTNSY